ncbi:MAG: FRG domain-containing protein [Planctomycetota bacterium]|nr:FRG domain-containing protein [Planctomycetota bacterium]
MHFERYLKDGHPRESYQDEIGKVYGVLLRMALEPVPEKVSLLDDESTVAEIPPGWLQIIEDQIFDLNRFGTSVITSCAEALVKCHGLKRGPDSFSTPMFFRGEHRFGWPLLPKFARQREVKPNDFKKITDEEIQSMDNFQNRVLSCPDLKREIFGERNLLPPSDAAWWSIKQHYDETDGTRMLDLTTSLFCALYFGCADWDGAVDETVDGRLYFFSQQPGRGDNPNPTRINGVLVNGEDQRQNEWKDYFRIEDGDDLPRFRISQTPNDRVVSQDGYFIWQPDFAKPVAPFGQNYSFRIHREAKTIILKELAAAGYTRNRILGDYRWLDRHG